MISAPTRGEAWALGVVFPILCGAVIFLRFYVRRQRRVQLLPDDWLTIPAWLFTTGVCVTIIYATEKNVFLQENLPVEPTVNSKQREFAAISGVIPILWLLAASCIKLSIIFLYKRIFIGRPFILISRALIAFNLAWTVYAFLSWLIFCDSHITANFRGSWVMCPSWGLHLQVAVYIWDTLIDSLLLILPIPLVLKLHMKPGRKFGLLLTFLLGCFAFVCSLLNTVLQALYITGSDIFSDAPNAQLPDEIFFYWQGVEIGVGLLFCNLPTLQPLYGATLKRIPSAPSTIRRHVMSLAGRSDRTGDSNRHPSGPQKPPHSLERTPPKALSPPRRADDVELGLYSAQKEPKLTERERGLNLEADARSASASIDLGRQISAASHL